MAAKVSNEAAQVGPGPNSVLTGIATSGSVGWLAQRGLLEVGHLVAGQRVLITGASGGVGTFAVQIAKATGAVVTGLNEGGHVVPTAGTAS